MSISDYRIEAVIRVYLRHLKLKTHQRNVQKVNENLEDKVEISEGAMKKLILERFGEKVLEMVGKHDKNT